MDWNSLNIEGFVAMVATYEKVGQPCCSAIYLVSIIQHKLESFEGKTNFIAERL